jgi:protein-S-isoprenylcysteine O-methyltransferase Ste14
MITYENVVILSWAAFLLVWGIGAATVKRDVRGGDAGRLWSLFFPLRMIGALFVLFAAARIVAGTAQDSRVTSAFFHAFFEPPAMLGWGAAALVAMGVGFAIWARFNLGRNWSSSPAMKENHELVTSGPYALVRHPIYAGVMLALFGSALIGSMFSIGMFIVLSTVFALRLDAEERIMLELFPNAYPAYQKRTKRLVPFVW